jgi:hypothetical protein
MVAETLRTELLKLVHRAAPHLSGPAKEIETRMRGARDAGECADILAGMLLEEPDERQALLEELDPTRRLTTLIAHVHRLSAKLPGLMVGAPQRMN